MAAVVWVIAGSGAPPGQPRWSPGHRLAEASVTYVVIARKGPRLTSSKRGWLKQLNGSAPVFQADAHSFSYDDRTGSLMLEAVRDAASRAQTPWLVFGDDDTHFDVQSIDAFTRTTSPPDNVVYGNVFDSRLTFPSSHAQLKKDEGCYRADSHGTFVLVDGWYTGGSGVLIPLQVARRLTPRRIAIWAKAARHCRCIDQPFACAMQDLGVRQQHRPNLFLDSCLDCLSMPHSSRRILTCHAVTAFRRKNVISRHKGNLDEKVLRLQYESFHFRRAARPDVGQGQDVAYNYTRPSFFENAADEVKMQLVSAMCRSNLSVSLSKWA